MRYRGPDGHCLGLFLFTIFSHKKAGKQNQTYGKTENQAEQIQQEKKQSSIFNKRE
jgi:hypothetical protein